MVEFWLHSSQSGWQPPSRAMHKLTCTNVCVCSVQVRLWPRFWTQTQLLWFGGRGVRLLGGRIGGPWGSNCRLLLVYLPSQVSKAPACTWMLCLNCETILELTCGSSEHVKESVYEFALLSIFRVAMPRSDCSSTSSPKISLELWLMMCPLKIRPLMCVSHLSLDCSVTILWECLLS